MNTEEGNKLIMFFDGAEMTEIDIMGKLEVAIKYKDSYYPEDNVPKFHEDWNLLMPVVEKIELMDDCMFKIILHFGIAFVNDSSMDGAPIVIRATGTNRLETTYNMVIKFIQWYNPLQPKT